ncbi:hypothetical protein MGH68_07845 [Erysipelothrix sp. D19-032]
MKILATTDLHGNIFPTNYTSRDNIESYGLARIASLSIPFARRMIFYSSTTVIHSKEHHCLLLHIKMQKIT